MPHTRDEEDDGRRGRMTSKEASMRGRIGAHASWANTADRAARTQPARDAFHLRFEREVDPDGVLDPAERARRAEHAEKAYMARMSLKAAQAKARRKAERKDG